MNYYFITGTGSGIGKALAEQLLADENNRIVGISRSCSVKHKNYSHLTIDLSNVPELLAYDFPDLEAAESIVLVNNAGMLGDIKHVGLISVENMVQTMHVNTIAVMVLCNQFLKKYEDFDTEKIIINITSGAASSPYDGWAAYCTSKAAVDMFTRVLAKEQTVKKYPAKVYAIAPGVVDTGMQDAIRTADKDNFSNIEKFINLKNDNKLYSTESVAGKLIYFIQNTNEIPDVVSRIQL
jgi:benzil reductase ((S)-benzoin forming)